jgi:hypothetical protein
MPAGLKRFTNLSSFDTQLLYEIRLIFWSNKRSFNAYLKKCRYAIMNNRYYSRLARRPRIFTMTGIIALFSLMVVPNSIGITYAQTTSARIQALLTEASHLKSTLQAQSTQISQLSGALRAGAVPSLSVQTTLGPLVTVPPGKVMESTVDCPAGSVATGGGQDTESPSLHLVQSFPHIVNSFTPIGWIASEFNPTTNTNLEFSVVVVCATVTQGTVTR